MWNMIIVDDEFIICRGLRSTIPWNEMNIEVLGEANNGVEAMGLLREHPVDIVLTDIRMPEMDGLALAKHIAEAYPDIRVILMSGYDDFEYARQALRLGVRDYLLKPVDIDDLSALVRKIGGELSLERQEKLEKWLLSQIFTTASKPGPELVPKDLRVKPAGYHIVSSQLEDYALLEESLGDAQLEDIHSQWKTGLTRMLSAHGFEAASVFPHKNLMATLVLAAGDWRESELVSLLNRFSAEWSGLAPIGFAVSAFKESLEACHEAYQEALSVIDVPFLKEMPVVFYRGGLHKSFFDRRIVYWEHRFIHWVFQQNKEELDSHVDAFFNEMAQEHRSLSDVTDGCKVILQGLFRRMQELEISYKGSLHFARHPDLRIHNTYDRLREWFREDLTSISSLIHASGYYKNRGLINKAEAYIREHLRENLKAAEVADQIHVSPGYFSQVFKQETGKSFNEYLNALRVNQAKELLAQTDQKVFEIAEKVGYNDYKHFVFIFKKVTGMTPTQYRELLLGRTSLGALENF